MEPKNPYFLPNFVNVEAGGDLILETREMKVNNYESSKGLPYWTNVNYKKTQKVSIPKHSINFNLIKVHALQDKYISYDWKNIQTKYIN